MECFGVFASKSCVADHSIRINFHQSTGLSHSIAFDDVFDDGHDFIFGQPRVEKDRSSVFREALFAHFALQ